MVKSVCIVGLGYVGLPLAELCSSKDYNVVGIDIDNEKITKINNGINYLDNSTLSSKFLATNDFSKISESNIIVVCVPTPVKEDKTKDMAPLITALNKIEENIKEKSLIIIESTVNPNAINTELLPILEKNNKKINEYFYLAHCPERIDPGNKKWDVHNLPRVLGASSDTGLNLAKEFYTSIIDAEITEMTSIKAAEAVKMVENSFRDLNIAFVNELAIAFDKMGINIVEVINGAKTKPFAFMPHYPSCGVGGHCIPVDPYYLIEEAKKHNSDLNLLKKSREINESMPNYVFKLLKDTIKKQNLEIKKIGILGLSYKAEIADSRESPSLKVINLLNEYEKLVYDPYLPEKSNTHSINELLNKVDAIILCTNHQEFLNISFPNNIKLIIDGKNCLNKEKIEQGGIVYKGIGINS